MQVRTDRDNADVSGFLQGTLYRPLLPPFYASLPAPLMGCHDIENRTSLASPEGLEGVWVSRFHMLLVA